MSALTRHIAEHVIGLTFPPHVGWESGYTASYAFDGKVFRTHANGTSSLFSPETSWADAGLVAETLAKNQALRVECHLMPDGTAVSMIERNSGEASECYIATAEAPTGPAAITLAAARATGFREEKA